MMSEAKAYQGTSCRYIGVEFVEGNLELDALVACASTRLARGVLVYNPPRLA